MGRLRSRRVRRRGWARKSGFWVGLLMALVVILGLIPVRLAISFYLAPVPQAIFVLDGNVQRVRFAAKLWQSHPHMDIWVSGVGSDTRYSKMLDQAGIPQSQIFYDVCATDTVTNFTCPVGKLRRRGLHHVYLVTSDYHMVRSRSIATIVFGSRGIVVTPLTVPSRGMPPESRSRVLRDCFRSLLWLFTGWTGASLNPNLPNYD
ncbi:MAG TPA: YdcF family protein [Oscillatoriaceae cyanobacterium M33_DOE_052]|uniref:YdcF family protein n=1 Tax=Planktothricoides sp. SpSt-374 TaxID=2282167 RepID=A0A7C3ZWG3_9CYAN|nr:YdcF family protein [Oscillatoriaceae cyanobacterium M33_DOE_052]